MSMREQDLESLRRAYRAHLASPPTASCPPGEQLAALVVGELEGELRRDYFRQLVGRRVQLLVESSRSLVQFGAEAPSESRESVLRGTTCRYAPAEMIQATAKQGSASVGDLIDVEVEETDGQRLMVS